MNVKGFSIHLGRLVRELGRGVRIGGRRYRIKGYLASQFAVDLRYERHLEKPLRSAMGARSGPVVDVGVNTGQTLLRVLSIDPDREYVGFEPQFACCALAQQFIRDNQLSRASVVGVALSDRSGLLPIYAAGSYDGMASLVEQSRTRYDRAALRQFVPVQPGDDALAELGVNAPAIIKVDVEGAELGVFRGLARTLERARPICFFEVLPNFSGHDRMPIEAAVAASNRETATALFAFFRDAGYRITQVDPAGDEHPIDAFDLDDRETYRGSDFVAHPR